MGAYKSLVIRDVELHRELKQRAVTLGMPLLSLVERILREGSRKGAKTRVGVNRGDKVRGVKT
jgi:hypothetical protein